MAPTLLKKASVVACLACLGASGALAGSPFTVTNTNDAGAGSLRQAIAGASERPNDSGYGNNGASRIVFTSNRDGNNEIYVMNPDGTDQTRLTNNTNADNQPTWSPDGSKIAFVSDRDGNFEIYVMNADGTSQTRLTNTGAEEDRPVWSPDGTRIAFVTFRDGNFEIYTMMASDGSNPTNLTNNPAYDSDPAWSPDGTKLAFASDRSGGSFDIFTMNASGASQTNITNTAGVADFQCAWSSDGAKIVFGSDRDGNAEIYMMNSDGGNQVRLTNNAATDFEPGWAPDSTKIVFESSRDGNSEIYVTNADGTNQTNISNNVAGDRFPAWQPGAVTGQLLNISTRMRVQSGENVLIGGFIVIGTESRQVIIRAIGPSLASFFPDALANPTLELFQGSTLLASNDNWRVPSQNESDVVATGIPPADDLESALVRTLQPGTYTAIVRGSDGASGIGLVEAYALGQGTSSRLANISTRGFVETDNNVMIGGLIIGPAGGSNARVVVRAIGPSLADFGIPGALQDPALELKDANGTTLSSNDDWQQGQPAEIEQAGLAPTDTRESALLATIPPGGYTAIVRGAGNTTGVGLVEAYHLQ